MTLGKAALVGWALLAGSALADDTSPRPAPRDTVAPASFVQWLDGFRARAITAGLSETTVEQALLDLRLDRKAIERDRSQSEFTRTIWDYLDRAVSDARVANGRKAIARHRSALRKIEAAYGVDMHIIAAIWGLESSYGAFRGSDLVVRSLATLAFDARRAKFFEAELIALLRLAEAERLAPNTLTGSWAGAMGHTQFMPSSYLSFAVDQNGDGKRDIWGADPQDALASTANYLRSFGWVTGQPWGIEVRLPEGFDYLQASRDILKPVSDWTRLGLAQLGSARLEQDWPASILLPAGATGPAFMIFKNFEVLERYNTADAYVIGVGHLADRLRGGTAFKGGWPRQDRALTFAERQELQRHLTRAGFPTKVDGRIGPLTIGAVQQFQNSIGALPDGYASLRILERLRQSN